MHRYGDFESRDLTGIDMMHFVWPRPQRIADAFWQAVLLLILGLLFYLFVWPAAAYSFADRVVERQTPMLEWITPDWDAAVRQYRGTPSFTPRERDWRQTTWTIQREGQPDEVLPSLYDD